MVAVATGSFSIRIVFYIVEQALEKLQLFLAGMPVGGDNLASKRIRRFAQLSWRGFLDLGNRRIGKSVARQ